MMNIVQVIPKTLLEFIAIIIMISSVYFFLEFQGSKNVLPYITLLGLILVRLIPSFNILSSSISALKYYSMTQNSYPKTKQAEFSKLRISNINSILSDSLLINMYNIIEN